MSAGSGTELQALLGIDEVIVCPGPFSVAETETETELDKLISIPVRASPPQLLRCSPEGPF